MAILTGALPGGDARCPLHLLRCPASAGCSTGRTARCLSCLAGTIHATLRGQRARFTNLCRPSEFSSWIVETEIAERVGELFDAIWHAANLDNVHVGNLEQSHCDVRLCHSFLSHLTSTERPLPLSALTRD